MRRVPSEILDAFPIPSDLNFLMVLPMLLVALTGIIALLWQVIQKKRENRGIIAVSLTGLVAAAIATVTQIGQAPDGSFAGMVIQDQFSVVAQLILIGACAMTLVFSEGYLKEKRIAFGEFYPLTIWATCGAMMMVTTTNLLVMFVGLEMLSIALYVLAGMSRTEHRSEESAMKYFLLGAFASAFFLYGIAFFFGMTGSIFLNDLQLAYISADQPSKMLGLFGIAMILIGLGFKSAFVPFHQWTPDVYQGAPTNVTAFMAVGSKVAAIAALYRVLQASPDYSELLLPALTFIAAATMIVGNLVALVQRDIKRVLGYSSIAHAGYLLTALLANYKNPGATSPTTILYYFLGYALMTLGAFAVISLVAKDGKEITRTDELKGLFRRSPLAAGALLICMMSLIGIPPTAGFVGKFQIFKDALTADLSFLAITLAATSAISLYYYLLIVHKTFVEDDTERPPMTAPKPTLVATVACAVGILLVGIFASPITRFLMGDETPPAEITASK